MSDFEVLGVHPIRIDTEILANSLGTRAGPGDHDARFYRALFDEIMTELEQTVLIEAVVEPVDGRLDPSRFVQPDRGEEWSAWLPRFLTPDGRSVVREGEPPEGALVCAWRSSSTSSTRRCR